MDDARIDRLAEKNKLLDLLIEPEARPSQVCGVVRESTGGNQSAQLVRDLFGVSEVAARGFLAASVELLTSGLRQDQLPAELAENRPQLEKLRTVSPY